MLAGAAKQLNCLANLLNQVDVCYPSNRLNNSQLYLFGGPGKHILLVNLPRQVYNSAGSSSFIGWSSAEVIS